MLSILLLSISASAQKRFSYMGRDLTTNSRCYWVGNKKSNASQYVFRTVQEALRMAERANNGDGEWIEIYISPSVYWIDDPNDPEIRKPDEGSNTPFGMEVRLNRVRLIGMGTAGGQTVLAVNRGQTQGAVGNFTMFHIIGNDFQADNITFGNYCNVDLDYEPDKSLSRAKRKEAIVQAQIGICQGENYMFRNCRFISRLNLCPFVGARNTSYEDCYFELTDDALNGNATYTRCRFTFFSSKPFYTTDRKNGAKFYDCDIYTKVKGNQYITKVSGPVEMTRCRWTSDDPDIKIQWDRKPDPRRRCVMTDCTLNGNPLNVPQPTEALPVVLPTLPIVNQPAIMPGQWTIDCYKPLDTYQYDWTPDGNASAWGYNHGEDGAEETWGLLQLQRGARLMYTPVDEDMPVTKQSCSLTIDPCKTVGQGFGSATGQYLDICIKFNTHTLTGYGLRLERTPDYDKAVVASLIEYQNGVTSVITEPEVCTLFRPGCAISIQADGDKLTATISNSNVEQGVLTLEGIMPHPNNYGGFHMQHTGSVGASAAVITSINLK